MKSLLIAITSVLILGACQQNGEPTKKEQQQAPLATTSANVNTDKINNANAVEKEKIMTLTGTVAYQNMEGGFYGFIDNKGNKYTPMNLSAEHRKNGLVIQISAKEVVGMMTTTQFGKLIEVTNIKVLDDSKISPINNTY